MNFDKACLIIMTINTSVLLTVSVAYWNENHELRDTIAELEQQIERYESAVEFRDNETCKSALRYMIDRDTPEANEL